MTVLTRTSLEFDLTNPTPEIVKQVHDAFEELANAALQAIETAKEANENAAAFEKQNKELLEGSISMTETMKAIFSVLGQKKDLWKNDADMKIIMDSLATFVLSSGAIKMGVIGATKESNNETKPQ